MVTAAIMELVSCFDLCFRFVEHYLSLRINLFLFVTLKASQIQLGEVNRICLQEFTILGMDHDKEKSTFLYY